MNTTQLTNRQIYLDWYNNWLTISKMAEHYQMSERQLFDVITQGRDEYNLIHNNN